MSRVACRFCLLLLRVPSHSCCRAPCLISNAHVGVVVCVCGWVGGWVTVQWPALLSKVGRSGIREEQQVVVKPRFCHFLASARLRWLRVFLHLSSDSCFLFFFSFFCYCFLYKFRLPFRCTLLQTSPLCSCTVIMNAATVFDFAVLSRCRSLLHPHATISGQPSAMDCISVVHDLFDACRSEDTFGTQMVLSLKELENQYKKIDSLKRSIEQLAPDTSIISATLQGRIEASLKLVILKAETVQHVLKQILPDGLDCVAERKTYVAALFTLLTTLRGLAQAKVVDVPDGLTEESKAERIRDHFRIVNIAVDEVVPLLITSVILDGASSAWMYDKILPLRDLNNLQITLEAPPILDVVVPRKGNKKLKSIPSAGDPRRKFNEMGLGVVVRSAEEQNTNNRKYIYFQVQRRVLPREVPQLLTSAIDKYCIMEAPGDLNASHFVSQTHVKVLDRDAEDAQEIVTSRQPIFLRTSFKKKWDFAGGGDFKAIRPAILRLYTTSRSIANPRTGIVVLWSALEAMAPAQPLTRDLGFCTSIPSHITGSLLSVCQLVCPVFALATLGRKLMRIRTLASKIEPAPIPEDSSMEDVFKLLLRRAHQDSTRPEQDFNFGRNPEYAYELNCLFHDWGFKGFDPIRRLACAERTSEYGNQLAALSENEVSRASARGNHKMPGTVYQRLSEQLKRSFVKAALYLAQIFQVRCVEVHNASSARTEDAKVHLMRQHLEVYVSTLMACLRDPKESVNYFIVTTAIEHEVAVRTLNSLKKETLDVSSEDKLLEVVNSVETKLNGLCLFKHKAAMVEGEEEE